MEDRIKKGKKITNLTRPGVEQCQAQGQVFCPCLGSIQDWIRFFKTNKSKLHAELLKLLEVMISL